MTLFRTQSFPPAATTMRLMLLKVFFTTTVFSFGGMFCATAFVTTPVSRHRPTTTTTGITTTTTFLPSNVPVNQLHQVHVLSNHYEHGPVSFGRSNVRLQESSTSRNGGGSPHFLEPRKKTFSLPSLFFKSTVFGAMFWATKFYMEEKYAVLFRGVISLLGTTALFGILRILKGLLVLLFGKNTKKSSPPTPWYGSSKENVVPKTTHPSSHPSRGSSRTEAILDSYSQQQNRADAPATTDAWIASRLDGEEARLAKLEKEREQEELARKWVETTLENQRKAKEAVWQRRIQQDKEKQSQEQQQQGTDLWLKNAMNERNGVN